jgi:hypothetical protein
MYKVQVTSLGISSRSRAIVSQRRQSSNFVAYHDATTEFPWGVCQVFVFCQNENAVGLVLVVFDQPSLNVSLNAPTSLIKQDDPHPVSSM